ncbi:hypothetical protein JCM1393_05080 [Clostridium carnis]
MKNTIISILLFVVLIAALFFLDFKFVKLCDKVELGCHEIEDLLEQGDRADAYEKAVLLLDLIKEEADIPALYLNHVDYDMLMNEALKLSLYIKAQDKAESLATLHVLRYTAEHLKDLQKPNFNNIL